jgi:hypothetical protein
MNARARLLGVALLVGLVAGCGGPPPAPTDVTSDVDRERAAFLSNDPVLKLAVSPPHVKPGVVHSEKLGWDRTEVSAELYQTVGGTGPTAETVEREVTEATTVLRDGGWKVHWEMCLPPPETDLSGMVTEEPIPVPIARAPGYEWLAGAYKISNGVSYWALVIGVLGDGDAFVQILLRAPNARDEANLFRSEPAAVAMEKACAEDGKVSEQVEQAGEPTMIRDWWPFPSEHNSRAPHQV